MLVIRLITEYNIRILYSVMSLKLGIICEKHPDNTACLNPVTYFQSNLHDGSSILTEKQ